MKLAVIGTGYVGLVSGACFSEFGFDVTCIDKDAGKIDSIRSGVMPIYEPGLEDLVARNVTAGRLHFTTELGPAIAGADAVFIAVGTPTRRGDGHADLTYVFDAARELAGAKDVVDDLVVEVRSLLAAPRRLLGSVLAAAVLPSEERRHPVQRRHDLVACEACLRRKWGKVRRSHTGRGFRRT